MPDLLHILHDRIDAREELLDDAAKLSASTLKGELGGILQKLDESGETQALDTIIAALNLLSASLAAKLDPLTTRGVKSGAKFGKAVRNA